MLTIRFSRKGKKKQPTFRILISEKSKDPWGDYLENIGNYNPRTKDIVIKADRLKYWMDKGAKPSDSIWNILVEKGLVEGKKRNVTTMSGRRKVKIEQANKKNEPVAAPAPEKTEAAK